MDKIISSTKYNKLARYQVSNAICGHVPSQFSSSELSPQSSELSHCQRVFTQCPFLHENSSSRQPQPLSSDASLQSRCLSQRHRRSMHSPLLHWNCRGLQVNGSHGVHAMLVCLSVVTATVGGLVTGTEEKSNISLPS